MRFVLVLAMLIAFSLVNTASAQDGSSPPSAAELEVSSLPQELNDSNVQVKFAVDSTWHMIHGKISKISGTIKLSDPQDYSSLQAEVHFPVKEFDTGWDMRDDSLHEHMKEEQFPKVVLKTSGVKGDCSPSLLQKKGSCEAELIAELTICDVSKKVNLPISIEKKEESYVISGEYSLKWKDYNVDDPSILVAKVDPTVTVFYSCTFPSEKIAQAPQL